MSETICLDTKKGQKEIGVTIDRANYKGDRVEVGDTVEIVADTPDNYTILEV